MKTWAILLPLWMICAPAYADEAPQPPATPPQGKPQGQSDFSKPSCDADAVVSVSRYGVASNNVFNAGNDADAMQCIGPHGWMWQWPANNSTRPRAFPAVLYGFKPFYPASTTPDMPIRISELSGKSVNFTVHMEASGSYNLQIVLWVTDGNQPTPTPESVKGQVVIWLDYHNMHPPGKPVRKVTINGMEFGVWKDTAGKVPQITFVSPKRILSGTLTLSNFLSDFPQNQLLASVELGNLLISGSGSTVVKKFGVQ